MPPLCLQPCNPCLDDAGTIRGVSSEAPDLPTFDSTNLGSFGSIIGNPFAPPGSGVYVPPGQSFPGTGGTGGEPGIGTTNPAPTDPCGGNCTSTASQEAANQCAAANGAACTNGNNGGTTFYNYAQTASVACAYGNPFTYTCPAGTFAAGSRAQANAIALSYAQGKVAQLAYCLSDISPPFCCNNQEYSGVISALPARQVTWVVTGNLPPGITYDPSLQESVEINQILLSGTPTSTGSFTFQVMATDPNGTVITQSYTINVYDISGSGTLPSGNQAYPYTYDFQPLGPVVYPLAWSVTAGALPPGLSLNSLTGALSGTPTASGAYQFTVSMTDSTPVTCSKQFNLYMNVQTWMADLVWTASHSNSGSGSVSPTNGPIVDVESDLTWNAGCTSFSSTEMATTNLIVTGRQYTVTINISYSLAKTPCPNGPTNFNFGLLIVYWQGNPVLQLGGGAGAGIGSPTGSPSLPNYSGIYSSSVSVQVVVAAGPGNTQLQIESNTSGSGPLVLATTLTST